LNLSAEGFEDLAVFSVLAGFSATLGVVDFFSLLAIKTKIIIASMKCRREACLTKNKESCEQKPYT